MNRRMMIAGGVGIVAAAKALPFVSPATAQEFSIEGLIDRISTQLDRELWALRLDAIWYPLVVGLEQGAIREFGSTQAALESYYSFRNRLLDEGAVNSIRPAIEDAGTRSEIENAVRERIEPRLPILNENLGRVGVQPGSPVAIDGTQALIVYSQFLAAQNIENVSWVCQVYGLRLIFC